MPINPETQAELIDPGVALATDLSMQEPQIETIATSKRKLPRALLAVGLGISSLVASVASEIAKDDAPAADANFQENPPLVSGTQFSIDVGVEEGSSVIGNATAINKGVGGGFVSVFGDEFKGTSTVNTFSSDGSDVVMPNTFIANPGADGEIGVRVGGSSDRQVVIDKIAELRDNPFTDIFETPRRIKDTRNSGEAVVAGGTVEVEVGKEYAGDFAIVNLTVDRNDGKGWHATYPCSEGYQGTSSLNAKGEGAQAILNVVKVDKDGNICVRSQDAAVGTIVDHIGVFKSEASAFERLVDTRNRSAGDSPLAAGQERGYVVGTPNSVFLGTIVSANPSKRGNVAVYSEQGGNNGTSLLNSDGENTASNFVILETDENGMIWMQSTYNTEIVIDGTQMDELKGFVTSDNQRLIDARFDTITPEASIGLISGSGGGSGGGPGYDPDCLPVPVYDDDGNLIGALPGC